MTERIREQSRREDSKGAKEFGRGSVGSQQHGEPGGRKEQEQNAQGSGRGGNLRDERAGRPPTERPD